MSRLGRSAPSRPVIIRALPGLTPADGTGTAVLAASATATASQAAPRPIVVGDANGPYLRARMIDPFTLIAPPVGDSSTGDASATLTLGASATASATSPTSSAPRPIVVSDAGAAIRARQFSDPATIIAPPAVDAPLGSADGTGALTLSASATALASTPGGRPAALVVQGDQAGAYRARQLTEPTILLAPPVQEANTATAAGTVVLGASATASASGPSTGTVRPPLVYTTRDAGYRARLAQYETIYILSGQADPSTAAGPGAGTLTLAGTATGSAIPPAHGDASATLTLSGTGTGQTGPLGVASAQLALSATATAHAATAVNFTGSRVLGAVATATQSGGNFHPVVGLRTFGRRLVRMIAGTRHKGRGYRG